MSEQQDLLKKAQKSLAVAKHNLSGGYFEAAASQGYYSMFYTARALLLNENINLGKKHSGVISAFGRDLAQTDKIPRKFHRILINAEELRLQADYGPAEAVTLQEAQAQIANAEQFLELGNRLIANP